MQLLIAGDLVPTKSNLELFQNANTSELLGKELSMLWNSAEIKVFNLEVPLSDNKAPIKKCGPNLISPISAIKGIKALNPTLITLANNHILDHGENGLSSTINTLDLNEIPHVGAGKNLTQASKPYIINKDGIKIGVYSCSEHEFSIATEEKSGANPFNSSSSFNHVKCLNEKSDFVIVVYHGGKEHYSYPSPNLQEICRKFVENGANLVVCQHSHCIGCEEKYLDSTIVYGQGNFIFDGSDNNFWKYSLIIQITFCQESPIINYLPIGKYNHVVRLLDRTKKDHILQEFRMRSEQIKDENFIHNEYNKFSNSMLSNYLITFIGDSIFVRLLCKIFGNKILKAIYTEKILLRIQNYIECEAHRELLINAIKTEIKCKK